VVTKAVRAYALVIGNAAKQIGWVSEYGHRLHFDDVGFAICEESKQQYKLQNNSVSRIA
jgi:UDP-2-acetamido-3-amino-2,3-dideoxy-glucuronate N-acetyltransferase